MEQTWEGNADVPLAVGRVCAVTAIIAVSCALSAALAVELPVSNDEPEANQRRDTPEKDTDRIDRNLPPSHQAPVTNRRPARAGHEGGAVCFGFFFLVIIVVIALVYGTAQQGRTTEAYSRLAERYSGTCHPGGWFTRPKVTFVHAGSQVLIDVYSTGGENATYYTQAHFYGRQPDVRCEVYPERAWSRLGKLLGMEDVEIGSPDFDDRYVIKGADPAALRKLLTPAVQLQIEHLRRFLGNDDIYVSFNRRELLVKKLSFIRNYYRLQEFTKLATELYDQALLAPDEGIEFVEHTAPPKASEVICQICGEPITSQAVFCRRCKTPHHHDCWEYYGACSTYGCGERRYLLPKPKRGKKPRKDTEGPRRTPKAPSDRHTRRGV